ncbi:MAG: hypothetical protein GX620_04585 [Chloroflexi bacterium]|nr:hypothetical protein [Chloroflexota bacterium]
MHTVVPLNGSDWQFRGYTGIEWEWRKAYLPEAELGPGWMEATVPGSVHHDLWQSGEIPDPYFERNSRLCEWVPERYWVYRKTFRVEGDWRGRRCSLRFKGVDYEAHFFLNGQSLGDHRGMYTTVSFDVTRRLHYDQDNVLVVIIAPAPREQSQMGRTSLVRAHKARMNYEWDFCPRMIHVGIWDDVVLTCTGAVRIEDVCVRTALAEEHSTATVRVHTTLSSTRATTVEMRTVLRHDGEEVSASTVCHRIDRDEARITTEFQIIAPRLWWPNGYGDPALYEAEVQVLDTGNNGRTSDAATVPFGIRTVEFVPNETSDCTARSYVLRVNGRRMYIKGWNWVPMDTLYGVERAEKRARLLSLAQRAHVNLLRVWGGGLIEKDDFYNLCDRLGILVWQEFGLSSSGVENCPSEDPDYIAMLTEEAVQIIRQKRNHPSLAIWCGGNELMDLERNPLDDSHATLGALRNVVHQHDPGRLWLPTSSTGPVFGNTLEDITRDPTGLHDVHGPWIHMGLTHQFTLYNRGTSLFHSEFGAEGLTNIITLERTIGPENRWPVTLENRVWRHLGEWWVQTTKWRDIFGDIDDLETLVAASQFLQADGLRYAVEADRRRKYQNSGSLPWQFDEPYPNGACTSAIDYYARPKPVYYAVAQAYEPVHVSGRFAKQAWDGERDFQAQVWASSSLPDAVDATLDSQLVGACGAVYWAEQVAVRVLPDAATLLSDVQYDLGGIREDIWFLDLRLDSEPLAGLSSNRYVFSRTNNLQPLLHIPPTTLDWHVDQSADQSTITITNTGEVTALFLQFHDARDLSATGYAYFDSNHFCLLPSETRSVVVTWEGVETTERAVTIEGWNTSAISIRIKETGGEKSCA